MNGSFAAALVALFAAQAAPPPPAAPTIVVQGVRDSGHAASDYIDRLLPPSFDAQFGRFEEPVCAGAVGLPDALRTAVLDRVRQVATAAAIRLAPDGCQPNLVIIVVDDKKTLIEGMRANKQSYLYGVGDARVKALEDAPGPVVAWQVSDVIGADGMPLRVDGDGYPRLFTTLPPSRLVNTTRKRLLGAVIVIEQRGLVGVDTRQLADYALVRAMAPIEPRERPAPSLSVLSLFDVGPAQAPQSLTWWDFAFLKALADTRSDLIASRQRDQIRTRMLAEMAKVPPDQR